jgi:hypothetical protein
MLAQLKLSNFRGYENHIINFRKITIVVGRNNAGKSTIVEALRLVSLITRRFQSLSHYHSVPRWADRPKFERCVSPSTEDFELSDQTVFYRHGSPPAKITAKFLTGEEIDVLIGPNQEVVGIIRDAKGNTVRSKAQAIGIQLPEVGILPQIGPILREERLLNEQYVRRLVVSSRSSLHFRNQIHYMKPFFKDFKNLVEATWGGVSVKPVEKNYITINETGLTLLVRDQDFTAEVGSMGHGLQMWLQTLWFLTHSVNSSSIILDEPDVYMHPDLQRRLIRLLRTRDHQTIIATHSVEIMSEVEADEILVIDRRNPQSTFADSQPEVQALLSNIGSVHNVQLARLGSAGRFVMVEGQDLDLLKRFQNTLFPESTSPVGALPHQSIGGWNGWERARGLASLLKEVAPSVVTPYCILDSDFHTAASIQKRLKTAKNEEIELHIWKQKEIENYLLIPTAIRRVLAKAPTRTGLPTEEKIIEKLESIAEELRNDTQSAMAKEFYDEKRELGFDGANRLALDQIDKSWKTFEGKMTVISGKRAISLLSDWCNTNFRASLNSAKIAKELSPSEISPEIQNVLEAIQDGTSFGQP